MDTTNMTKRIQTVRIHLMKKIPNLNRESLKRMKIGHLLRRRVKCNLDEY